MTPSKLDPNLTRLMQQDDCPEMIPVIVQTVDDPTEADRKLVKTLKGRFKEQFTIIPAFEAELSATAIESIILSDRVVAVSYNAEI